MRRVLGRKSSACIIVACLFLLSAPAAETFGATSVRFVHAVPNAGTGELTVSVGGSDRNIGGGIRFGQVSDYVRVPSGAAKLEVKGSNGRRVARSAADLAGGARYTAVLMARDGGASMRLYRDGRPPAGRSSVRVIHASPELGKVDLRLDGEVVGKGLAFHQATPYRLVEPGKYDLAVRRAGSGGAALASRPRTTLTAGTASTAFLLGSRGERVSVVVASDSTVAPGQAPETGLGGLADDGGPSWTLIALVALLAGSLGGGAYLLTAGPRRGRGSRGG
jgi:uncharacterized protein DUF4397